MFKTTRTMIGVASLGMLLGSTTACQEAEAKVAGEGDSLKAFIIENCATNERYCQVCAYSGSPTVMAVGDVEDPKFTEDLKQIQSLYESNKAAGLTAFALYGRFVDGKLTAIGDDPKTIKRLAELRKELGLTFPITVLPKKLTQMEARMYTAFSDSYAVKKSRTVMVAKANNKIVWADTLKGEAAQYAALAAAVKKAL